jgi:predicted DNA binding CopG/RHH family protein
MKKIKPIFNLTPEELAMEASVDWDNVVPATDEEKAYYQQIAKNTTAKNKAITVRLSERTLMRLKAKAAQEGLPYQTFLASLIHKNV